MISNKEFETRLSNLEKAVLQMAANGVIQTQTVDESKGNIAENKRNIDTHTADIEELEISQADTLLQLCEYELGIEE